MARFPAAKAALARLGARTVLRVNAHPVFAMTVVSMLLLISFALVVLLYALLTSAPAHSGEIVVPFTDTDAITDCSGQSARVEPLPASFCLILGTAAERIVLAVKPAPREVGYVSGVASGKRPVYAAAGTGRGKKLGDLAVGPTNQPSATFTRVRCNPQATVKSGLTVYAQVAEGAFKGAFVSGCVSVGAQSLP